MATLKPHRSGSQERTLTDDTCGHLGPKFRVRDMDGNSDDTISCAGCIEDELEMLSVGAVVQWELERLSDELP